MPTDLRYSVSKSCIHFALSEGAAGAEGVATQGRRGVKARPKSRVAS